MKVNLDPWVLVSYCCREHTKTTDDYGIADVEIQLVGNGHWTDGLHGLHLITTCTTVCYSWIKSRNFFVLELAAALYTTVRSFNFKQLEGLPSLEISSDG